MKKNFVILVVFLTGVLTTSIMYGQSQPDSLLLEGQRQMQYGRYGEAIDQLNKYISAHPQEADGYNLRGICYEKRNDYENAVYDYRSALKLEPQNNDINSNLNRATAAWYSLLYNNIEGHKRELAINPNTAINYLAIGKAYKNLGKWEDAEDWYDQYLSREEASADEIIRYSEILAKNNHIAKGEPILKKYLEKYPNDQRLWSRYGYFSLWLGKNQTAIDAFEHALALRPYFKEAQDGIDQARGNGYIYTINDTSTNYSKGRGLIKKIFEYPIDRDYRLLKRNPKDNDLRFKLVKELVSAKRFVEATQFLDLLLKDTTSKNQDYNRFYLELKSKLKKLYREKINEYSALIKKNPPNKKAVISLAEYYEKTNDYDNGIKVLEDYLAKTSSKNTNDVKFLYARLESENKDFLKAITIMNDLVKSEPDNYSYKLFHAQLSVWQGINFGKVKPILENMVIKNPKDLSAMITLASLGIQEKDFVLSRNYINKIKEIDPANPNLADLESDFALGKEDAEKARLFDILQEGRKLSLENRCQEALAKYDEYLASAKLDTNTSTIRREYADVNVCAKNYEKALGIYDTLLNKNYDYDTDLMRAKTYYYMRDSIDALNAFQRLAKQKPHDFLANLYLGDSYVMMERYGDAADVFDNMKTKMKLDSSQTALVELREGWLPKFGFGSSSGQLLSYAMISPYGSYYGDNLGFKLNNQGVRIDLGVTSFLMLGVEGFRTALSNDSINQNINNIKLNLQFHFARNATLGMGYGKSIFDNAGTKIFD